MKKIYNLFFISAIVSFAFMLVIPCDGLAKKQGYKLTVNKNDAKDNESEMEMARGSFMVASYCRDCNNGYRLDQIVFTGFDKPQSSASETFFITNNTDRTLSGINLYIEYTTLDGRQLHKRFVKLSCNIPAGETRMADIPTWDKQKSFFFEKSAPSKRVGTPFRVIFDPVAFYLRY